MSTAKLRQSLPATLLALLGALAPPSAAPAHERASAKDTGTQGPAGSEAPAPPDPDATVWNFGRFGGVSVYRPDGEIRQFVMFLSGDGGWNAGVISMARHLRAEHAVVAGIDVRHYLSQLESSKDACVSVAADLENLSRYLQQRLSMKDYLQPTLVGYSSGADLAYAALAEGQEGAFKGGLTLGFCPDLDLREPLCKGSGLSSKPRTDKTGKLKGVDLNPTRKLAGRWITLQGETDQVCPAPATQHFVGEVSGAEIVMLPKVGHGYSVEKNWLPQYLSAFVRLTAQPPKTAAPPLAASVADLPLILVPAPAGGKGDWFGVFLSGDGGWVGLDRGVSDELARHDIPIVGWDSLRYFWSARTPQGASADLDRVVRHFSQAWKRGKVLMIGYSQGADTMPFMINRLPAAEHDRVGFTALLGISDNALFEFHVTNWLGDPGGGLPTAPELAHWRGPPYLCLYGVEDADSACTEVSGKEGIVVKMPGGHHFGGGYQNIAAQILSRMPKAPR